MAGRRTGYEPGIFLSVTDFFRGFADGCHHQKEEGILFKCMEEQGVPVQGCPLGVMLAEHELGRQYTLALLSAAQSMQSGDLSAHRRAIQSSCSYITLLRLHFNKENNILFPMADKVIPVDQYTSIWEDFDHFEHAETGEGHHEIFLVLAKTLEDEIKAYS